jgi:hypothetical protein
VSGRLGRQPAKLLQWLSRGEIVPTESGKDASDNHQWPCRRRGPSLGGGAVESEQGRRHARPPTGVWVGHAPQHGSSRSGEDQTAQHVGRRGDENPRGRRRIVAETVEQ